MILAPTTAMTRLSHRTGVGRGCYCQTALNIEQGCGKYAFLLVVCEQSAGNIWATACRLQCYTIFGTWLIATTKPNTGQILVINSWWLRTLAHSEEEK
jgi:hypothetical protein